MIWGLETIVIMNEQASKKCCAGNVVSIKDVPPDTPFCWGSGTAKVVARGFAGGFVIQTDAGFLTTVDADLPVRLCEVQKKLRPLTDQEMRSLVTGRCILYKSANEFGAVVGYDDGIVLVGAEYCDPDDLLEWFWDEDCTRPVGVEV